MPPSGLSPPLRARTNIAISCWRELTGNPLSRPKRISAQPSAPVVAVATESPVLEKVLSNVEEVRARGAATIAIATEGDELAVYRVLDAMGARGWSLNGLHHPPATHVPPGLRRGRDPRPRPAARADLQRAPAWRPPGAHPRPTPPRLRPR